MTPLDHCLLGLRATSVANHEYSVVVVQLLEPKAEFQSRSREDLLQRWDARLAPATFNPGDLGLGNAGPLGQLSL